MTEPLIDSAAQLLVVIGDTLDDAARAAGGDPEMTDTNPHIRRIMNAAGAYTDAIIARGKEHRPHTITDHAAGPALVYIHTDNQTITLVDRGTVPPGREHAIAGALINEAHRLHHGATPTQPTLCLCGHPLTDHSLATSGCKNCACRQCCAPHPFNPNDYCTADDRHTDAHLGRDKTTWSN